MPRKTPSIEPPATPRFTPEQLYDHCHQFLLALEEFGALIQRNEPLIFKGQKDAKKRIRESQDRWKLFVLRHIRLLGPLEWHGRRIATMIAAFDIEDFQDDEPEDSGYERPLIGEAL